MLRQASFQHWNWLSDDQKIVWLTLDRVETSGNTIDVSVLESLQSILTQTNWSEWKGLVIGSGKANLFCLGADVHVFKSLGQAQTQAFLELGHTVFAQLAALPVPTVALINGHCLGGGYELALACDYRVALNDWTIKIGLPEVQLGIHPGWGGCVRLPKLIGSLSALPLMMKGQSLTPLQALKQGLVDHVVDKRMLKNAAIWLIGHTPAKQQPPWYERALQCRLVRQPLYRQLQRMLKKKTNKLHYPAPYAVLEHWYRYYGHQDALLKERTSVLQLFEHPTTKQLVRVFGLREQLKKRAKTSLPPLQHIHVVGCGVMGADIAILCALHGFSVSVQDKHPAALASLHQRAKSYLTRQLTYEHLITQVLDRLIPDPKGDGIGQADLVIEAVIEDLHVKQTVLKAIEQKSPANALIATNTSSIPLEAIGSVLKQPSRLLGIHYFNPVLKLPLVELIYGQETDSAALQKAQQFILKTAKLPLLVKSHPGFLVNRILMPYLLEAMEMVSEEKLPQSLIDLVAKQFGMPMGPIELADHVGLDVCHLVGKQLSQALGQTVPSVLTAMVQKGHLGRKTKQGFYTYKNNQPLHAKVAWRAYPTDEILDRLMLRMIIEAHRCLKEGVVEDEAAIDAGLIFGTGFPAFRGGLMSYAQQLGGAPVWRALAKNYAHRYGKRFDYSFD